MSGTQTDGKESLRKPERNGIVSVALSFLRRPVDTIIRLTEARTYRGHWIFLATMLGAQLLLVFALLPWLFSALFNIPDTSNSTASIINALIQYAAMVSLTPLQFYVCRALGSVKQPPRAYVKLCALIVSFYALLSIVVALLLFSTTVLTLKANLPLNLTAIWQASAIVTLGGVIAFVAASHRRFWGMTWVIATSVTVVFASLSWLAVYPTLAATAEKANIAANLGRLFR